MDFIEIKPIQNVDATVKVAGSKSYTNRALAIAALAQGKSILKNALFSDDTIYMAKALQDLGFSVEMEESQKVFTVHGLSGRIPSASAKLFVGNAGTAMRFLTALCSLGKGTYILDGIERMRQRPIRPLVDALRDLGVNILYVMRQGYPPIKIETNGLNGGTVHMEGTISSQYFSAVMISAAYAGGDVSINVKGNLTSQPYINMTIGIMKEFGVTVENNFYRTFTIPARQQFRSRSYDIEPDASNASYFFAAAAILKGRVRVERLSRNSLQGDVRFVYLLERMGCTVTFGDNWIEVEGGNLKGIDVDMNDCPDVAQTLAMVALFADGPTTIRNVANMRIKETDRLKALANELAKLSIRCKEHPDGITIQPGHITPARIETYDDHRMAMSFALVGLKVPGISIANPSCVDKTYPDFFSDLQQLYQEQK